MVNFLETFLEGYCLAVLGFYVRIHHDGSSTMVANFHGRSTMVAFCYHGRNTMVAFATMKCYHGRILHHGRTIREGVMIVYECRMEWRYAYHCVALSVCSTNQGP